MFKYIFKYIFMNKIKFVIYILISLLLWAISIYIPILNSNFIDTLTFNHEIYKIKIIIILIVILSLVNLFLSYFFSVLNYKIITTLMYNVSNSILTHIQSIPISFSYSFKSGYLSQRILTDSNIISNFTISSIKDILIKSLTFIFSFIILLKINIKLGIILIALIPIYIIIYSLFKVPMYKSNKLYKEAENNYFEEINSQIECIKFLKINSLRKKFENNLFSSFNCLYDSLVKLTKISTLFSNSGTLITICANIMILILGVNEILNNNLTIGQFTIINTYFNTIISSVDYALSYLKNYQNALTSYNRIQEIMNIKLEDIGSKIIDNIQTIKIDNLTFKYNESYPLLNKFNYTFEKGYIYRIYGDNGSGKSSFINLILGLYNNSYKGNIYYNNIDLKEINIYALRKDLISVVEQDLTIINGTVLDNLILNNEPNIKIINKLIKNLNMSEFIKKLPDGLNTPISRKSYNLSGGEKQKLNIIRSFIKKSNLLILDEANSSLDENSNILLKELIMKEKKNRITLLICHNDTFNDIIDYNIDLNIN